MASGHSDYIHGTMAVDGHDKTFKGFARTSSFVTAFLVVILLMPILIFAANIAWFPALIITFIVGVLISPAFKLGGGWYATLFGLGVLGFILGFAISSIAG